MEIDDSNLNKEEIINSGYLRHYSGIYNNTLKVLLVMWSIVQIYWSTIASIDAITLRASHALFLIFFTFYLYPINNREDLNKIKIPLLDILLMILTIFIFSYMILKYPQIAMAGGFLETEHYLIAAAAILLILEAGRRASPKLVGLTLFFLGYNFFGQFIPGPLGHTGLSIKRVLSHLFWGSQGVFGIGIGVSATYIFLFVLFGTFLKYSGFSQFINDFALSIVGKSPGGPAKVAVLASAGLGMINGSAVANVATTGTITIPMMKDSGYSSEFAAAVEAASSTGGQFAPPIMGAVGFVMAEFLGVPYPKVLIAAIVPAFLYYLGIIISVHLEAKRLGLTGLKEDQIPNIKDVVRKNGHLSLPLFILIGMMITGKTALFSAVVAIFGTVLSSWIKKETRMGVKDILNALVEGSQSAISVGISCVLIGIIIGTVSLTGLGLSFGNLILSVVQSGQLLLGGFMVMIMSIILGMGVPGVAAYVIVVSVAVPVLIKVGANPMASHMFCLIYACLSNITPPVAISSYVASGIANSDMTETSKIAVKLGIVGFIIPFFFLTNPILLIGVLPNISIFTTIFAVITAIIGVLCLSSGFQGMLYSPCSIPIRIILILSGLLTMHPSFLTDIIGVLVLLSIYLIQRKQTSNVI